MDEKPIAPCRRWATGAKDSKRRVRKEQDCVGREAPKSRPREKLAGPAGRLRGPSFAPFGGGGGFRFWNSGLNLNWNVGRMHFVRKEKKSSEWKQARDACVLRVVGKPRRKGLLTLLLELMYEKKHE